MKRAAINNTPQLKNLQRIGIMYLMQIHFVRLDFRVYPLFRLGVFLRHSLNVLNHFFGKEPLDCVVRF
jgi:hypothetical protein